MDGLSNFITIPFFLITLAMSVVCVIWPVWIIRLLFLWPATLKHLFGIKFPLGGDETLSMVYKDVSSYKIKYKGQVNTIQIMGFIGIIIATVSVCKLLSL